MKPRARQKLSESDVSAYSIKKRRRKGGASRTEPNSPHTYKIGWIGAKSVKNHNRNCMEVIALKREMSLTKRWVLPEKLSVTQLVKKSPTFYRTRRFTTVFRRPRHWSLTWTTMHPDHTFPPTLFPNYAYTQYKQHYRCPLEWSFLTYMERSCPLQVSSVYEDISKSFRTGRLEQQLQMVQLSTTRWSCIAIL